ncbi:MAG: carboxypeptidase regulatory-like domain-containing protein [Bacteroidota bacterium]
MTVSPHLLLPLLLLAWSPVAFAQPTLESQEISGQVVDARTGRPVSHAHIQTRDARSCARANALGHFRIRLTAATHVTVAAEGYVPERLALRQGEVTGATPADTVPGVLIVRLVREPHQPSRLQTLASGWTTPYDDDR